ncbi:AAA family ATPase [Deinococcus radiotolerans]|uniref:Chromosome partitioning protein ParA n=1 Tax=Deinococcus radiotolerans TaxID=1309407 RepID=A0ABQ2FP56_9DEIO|nr:AAA family ATPase [Deinococcus radiotolerans]GGL13115.1 chromosome partitioning protein ParA [Deinococcus radiotolerans]
MDIEVGRMYTLRELASGFSVSERTLTRKLELGELRGYKVGNQWRVRGREWLEYTGALSGPRVFVVANAKGGAGKSTFTTNLAVLRAREGKRVLLIDLDPQGHLATLLNMPVDPDRTTVQLLNEELRLPRTVPGHRDRWHTLWTDLLQSVPGAEEHEALSRVFLVPAHNDLADLERANFHRSKPIEYALREAIEALTLVNPDIDEIWIDTPPNLGSLTRNALMAAHYVVSPFAKSDLGLDGLERLMVLVEQYLEFNPYLRVAGLVMNYGNPRTIMHNEIRETIKGRASLSPYLLESYVSEAERFNQAPRLGVPLVLAEPNSTSAQELRRVLKEMDACVE